MEHDPRDLAGIADIADDSGVAPAVLDLLGPDPATRVTALSADDPQRTKAEVVASFLQWLTTKKHAPTGPEAARWVRDSGLVAWSDNLEYAAEIMIEVADISVATPANASPYDGSCPIPASAFTMAALLLVASHVVGAWPFTILMSPQDTINFKSATRASTLIVDGAAEGATLFEHGAAPAFEHIPAANVVDVYVRKFLEAPMPAWEMALCGLLSAAAADIAAD